MDPQELANLAHLRRARDLIDREYARPLDVPTMAKHALMSPAHFSRRFRAAYGETPYNYLMTRRIERAMTLLRAGMSVTDACMTVGCTSLGSFSSRFTEIVGETPSAYRGRAHDAVTAMPACVAKVQTRPSRNAPVPAAPSTGVPSTGVPGTGAPAAGDIEKVGNVPSRIREAGRTAAA
ncbi:helix-turn-helix transcriptional regulator [Streptomyces lacrimifluminis]|uniref:Transcriptional regulator n=1 Tax=Streptomyces lacrimifluminis TaxID=1500077 RepID=A0A917NKU6_9ACTN|nr:helix-turn-helix transcriptional regulator [Streptomyces lacrimifluminis]GGJ07990.1 transcriptional regulator [Streptomyces lacrimifluminis]